jgi:hypothetical protein
MFFASDIILQEDRIKELLVLPSPHKNLLKRSLISRNRERHMQYWTTELFRKFWCDRRARSVRNREPMKHPFFSSILHPPQPHTPLSFNIRAGGVAQVVQYLPNKCEALSSNLVK